MNKEEILAFNRQLNDLEQDYIKLLDENQQLKDKINKALHRIQLLQMDGEVSIKDLGKIANILIDKEVE